MVIKHITNKLKKTLQRQISSIPARHDKHDIARDIALIKNTREKTKYGYKNKTNKNNNINCHEELASSKIDPSKRRVDVIKVITALNIP